jgi:CubicO group peptidase (beta-lactamase class C family)
MVQCLLFASLDLRKEIMMFLAKIKPFFLLLLLFSLISRTSLAQDEEDPIRRIDNVLRIAADDNRFSGSILIARDGEILLNAGYGYAVREWDVPNTSDSVFYIGSITKQFTAMGILSLQEDGLLSVEDSICDYLEDCTEAWQDITIHQLLNHTSGIKEYTSMAAFNEQMTRFSRPENLVDWFIEEPLDFVPGEAWSYSNSGYHLLGLIIANVSEISYPRFLNETFFEPLGMAHTGYGSNTRIIENLADGYAGSSIRAAYIDYSIPYSAGGLYSTVGDLYLWNQALHNGEIVSQETWDAMLEAAYPMGFGNTNYAYGLIMDSNADYPYIGHGGSIPGYSSFLAHLPEQNMDIVILENIESNPTDYVQIFANVIVGD